MSLKIADGVFLTNLQRFAVIPVSECIERLSVSHRVGGRLEGTWLDHVTREAIRKVLRFWQCPLAV